MSTLDREAVARTLMGLPISWEEALRYGDAVLALLPAAPPPVPEAQDRIENLAGRLYTAESAQILAEFRDRELGVALREAEEIVQAYRDDLNNLSCSDLCDKTYEFQGCHGPCALEESKRRTDTWLRRARQLLAAPAPPAGTGDAIRRFAQAVLHGDEEHRAWLVEAAEAFIAGERMPEPRGGGKTEAALTRKVKELEDGLRFYQGKGGPTPTDASEREIERLKAAVLKLDRMQADRTRYWQNTERERARLEEALREDRVASAKDRAELEAEVERLTRERDEARADLRSYERTMQLISEEPSADLARARADALEEAASVVENFEVLWPNREAGKCGRRLLIAAADAVRALADSEPAGQEASQS
jgi:hypothetical protein